MSWLREVEVVEAVHCYLEAKGFKINRAVRNTTDRGTDIVATSPSQKAIIKIEAKGQTSSDKGSKRFGKEFDKNQKEDHLGRALVKCLGYLDEGFGAGIAFPEDDYHKRLVDGIKKSLGTLGLLVFFLSKNSGVSVIGDLPL